MNFAYIAAEKKNISAPLYLFIPYYNINHVTFAIIPR